MVMHHKYLKSVDEIDRQQWNQLCATDYPFIKHEFLSLLESSQSVCAATGWTPHHLIIFRADAIIAALPLYLKTHSYGEYVFDWAWARAYHEHGLRYYPKLVSAIPFTPSTGERLLLKDSGDLNSVLEYLIQQLPTLLQDLNASSWHCLFPSKHVAESFSQASEKILQRIDVQFHWHNKHYQSWDDFIQQLQSRKRKNILKERQAVKDQGINFITKASNEISEGDWKIFYDFYRNTYLKRSGHNGYLTEAFFIGLGQTFANHSVMVQAFHQNKPIAAALFFRDSETLYGRYWGCNENYDFLHFETCYYQGIDFAIAQGIKRFDGGAQGEHKIARGFEPQLTYSNHWIVWPQFRDAIKNFIHQENKSVLNYFDDVKNHLPFKNIDSL